MLDCPNCGIDLTRRAADWTPPAWVSACPECSVELGLSGWSRLLLFLVLLASIVLACMSAPAIASGLRLATGGRLVVPGRDIAYILGGVIVLVFLYRETWLVARMGSVVPFDRAAWLRGASRVVTAILVVILGGLAWLGLRLQGWL